MKKLILAVWLMSGVLGASAQEEMAIEKVKKGEEPQAVMDAIKNNFPQGVSENMVYLPKMLYGKEWNINVKGNRFKDADFYQIDMREGNKKYTAVYDRTGKLLSSKEVISSAELPAKVQETVNKFKGWHIDNSTEVIKYNGKKVTDVYRVKLQKEVEHKIIYLDFQGNIINTRFTII